MGSRTCDEMFCCRSAVLLYSRNAVIHVSGVYHRIARGERMMWYNVVRHYTSADSRPTRGRTVSKANRVHPAEHIMSEGHGIMVTG